MSKVATCPEDYNDNCYGRHCLSAETRSTGMHAPLPKEHPLALHHLAQKPTPGHGFFAGGDGRDKGVGGRQGTKHPSTNDQSSVGARKDFHR